MSETQKSHLLLETHDLSRYFGGLKAVDGVNFRLNQGDFHSIIGPNGAGKTTFLNLISGTLKPTHGRVIYKGQDITDFPIHRMAHLGIARSYQITNLFPTLTVLENIRLAAQALGTDNFRMFTHYNHFKHYEDGAWSVLEKVGLASQALIPVISLSHGDKRRLELAMLLAQNPDVLLLDEPTAGLATEQVPEFMALVKEVHDKGDRTIVLVEHNMSVVMTLSNRISVMHQGRILAEGTPREISANETVQHAYLGTLYEDSNETRDPNSN